MQPPLNASGEPRQSSTGLEDIAGGGGRGADGGDSGVGG